MEQIIEERFNVVIIGAGFSGIGMGAKLLESGERDFIVLDKAPSVGGTWWWNRYPGCACDIASLNYQYSWRMNSQWSSLYPSQPEILQYLRDTAAESGLYSHLRLSTELLSADWDSSSCTWLLRIAPHSDPIHPIKSDLAAAPAALQPIRCRFLVSAVGALHTPHTPIFPSRDTFSGSVMHTAEWDTSIETSGRRVVVIGSAASAVQCVPEIARDAAHVTVIQRTPNYFFPRDDAAYSPLYKFLYCWVPGLMLLRRWIAYFFAEFTYWAVFSDPRLPTARLTERMLKRRIRLATRTPELAQKMTPEYRVGCKRILIHNDYLRCVRRPNVTVETKKVSDFSPHGILLEDGSEVTADVVVMATGFAVLKNIPRVTGHAGTLEKAWEDGARSHLGVTVSGFPNFFVLLGPNTGLGHNSVVYMIECQVNYILQCMKMLEAERAKAMEVTAQAQDEFCNWVRKALKGTTWESGGCLSWYKSDGNVFALWPGFTFSYWWATLYPKKSNFTFVK